MTSQAATNDGHQGGLLLSGLFPIANVALRPRLEAQFGEIGAVTYAVAEYLILAR